jgi:hypothetical protein
MDHRPPDRLLMAQKWTAYGPMPAFGRTHAAPCSCPRAHVNPPREGASTSSFGTELGRSTPEHRAARRSGAPLLGSACRDQAQQRAHRRTRQAEAVFRSDEP